jgi:hypothetical protein
MNLKNKNTQFVLFWILLQVFFNWIEYIHLPPFGIHQGAQADRASIALNYFNYSENFSISILLIFIFNSGTRSTIKFQTN